MDESQVILELFRNPTVGAIIAAALFVAYKSIQLFLKWIDDKQQELACERDKRLQEHRDFADRTEKILERTISALENSNRVMAASTDNIEFMIQSINNNELLHEILSAVTKGK